MQNKCVLSELYKHHNSWVNFAITFNCGDYSEDIVQEFYMRVDRYKPKQLYLEKGINLNYAFFILKNLILTYLKARGKAPKHIDIDERLSIEFETDVEQKEVLENIISKSIECVHENFDSFDSMLFELYLTNKTSYRKIASESGIPNATIRASLMKTRNKIKQELQNEYNSNYGTR